LANKYAAFYLHELGRSVGKSDVDSITPGTKDNPLDKLALLATSLAQTGWGKLEFLSDSIFQYHRKLRSFTVLAKCRVQFSFESSCWINENRHLKITPTSKIRSPVCFLLCGYCSGWASSVFNTKLVVVELSCRCNTGAAHCEFALLAPERMDDYLKKYYTEGGRHLEEMHANILIQILKMKQEGITLPSILPTARPSLVRSE
jgi:hypothetical protein